MNIIYDVSQPEPQVPEKEELINAFQDQTPEQTDASSDTSLISGFRVVGGQIVNINGEVIPDIPYTMLNLSVRPFNVLTREQDRIKAEGHETLMVSDLLCLSVDKLAGLRNMGAKSYPEIIQEIERYLCNPTPPAPEETMIQPPVQETEFASDYEIVGRVIRQKHTAAIVTDSPVQQMGLNIRNQAALLAGGFQKISDLIHVDYSVFQTRTGLGKKSTHDIAEKLKEYLIQHQEFYGQDASAKTVVTPGIIMEYFGEHEFGHVSGTDLLSAFEGTDETVLMNLVNRLVNEGKLVKEGDSFCKFHRSLFPYMFTKAIEDYPKLKAEYLDVIRWRSLGNTLEEVGRSRGMTRERIRQIEQKTFDIITEKKKVFFAEDAYAYLFQTYETDRDVFGQGLKLSPQIWYYLSVRYERGKKPLSEALEDQFLSAEDRYAIEKYIHRDDLCIDGRYIPRTRSGVEKYLLERCCRDEMAFSDFVTLCDEFIREHHLPVDEEETSSPEMLERARINRVSRMPNVLWKQNQRLRYYNIDGEDFSELLETIDLSRFHNIEISTRKLMSDFPEVMQRYDIRDEYELHNLLKKIHAEKENPTLVFGRMPGLVFGMFSRDEAVKEIMFALAPVSQDDLIEMINLEYGVREDTVRSNWLGCISEYLHQGMYSIEYQDMPSDQMETMKAVLTDVYYSFDEVKELYLRHVENPDLSLLSSYNLKRMGFNVGTSYIIRQTTTAEEYFRHLLTGEDRIDITADCRRFNGLTTFSSCLAEQRHDLNMLEYEPYKYVNIRMLERSGFGKERLRAYSDRVWEFIQNHPDSSAILASHNGQGQYFTVVSLKNAGFTDELDLLGFGDLFFASILREDGRFSWQRIGKMTVFNTQKAEFATRDFLSAYIDLVKSINVQELTSELMKRFGIDLDKWTIVEKIDKDQVYYDPVMGKLHANYAVFKEEAETLFHYQEI